HDTRPGGGFFEIWRPNGKAVLRSASLAGIELPYTPINAQDDFGDVRLQDGRTLRVAVQRFQPRLDGDDPPERLPNVRVVFGPPKPETLLLAIAHNRHDIDAVTHLVLIALIITALIVAIGVAIIVWLAVRRALKPVLQIGEDVDRIDANDLMHRFNVESFPTELAPICGRLNDLMSRLQLAFERQRRFTADAAHELRTPIAELRTMTEVALRWPGDPPTTDRNLGETLQIAKQMESIVKSLLKLARCESGRAKIDSSPVRVRDAFTEAWTPLRDWASARELQIVWTLGADAIVVSDSTMLVQILANLLSNAVNYAPPQSRIEFQLTLDSAETVIAIGNDAPLLAEDDLNNLFEPFWRKSAARTADGHTGLGLSIAAAYAKALDHRLTATLENGMLWMRLRISGKSAEDADDVSDPRQSPIEARRTAEASSVWVA
ncbi:MAG: hypothetical protein JO353_04595, partial [Phycisphaerae bacterium]|nr:hypothetical protein [Phycisphaerae bacterium]